ncbi:hypothetical protein WJX73_006705 [Symbiochloris irregularis]|uniref:RNA helicase n=1 Tax=Symbiochloris irregularis TaxID=706552 RepID=A0AAW1NTF0_9CHLO
MEDRNLSNWVGDQLHALCGMAEGVLTKYIISLANKSSGPSQLAGQLQAQGLPNSTATFSFAQALYDRIPRASAAPNAYRQQERTAVALHRRNAKYAMLSDDEDPEDEPPPPAPTTAPVPTKRKKKSRHKPQEEAENGETTTGLTDRLAKRQRRAWEEGSSSSDDEEKQAERQRLKDQQDKEEFEARLKARDEAKTRRIAEARLSKEEVQEMEKRKYETEEQRDGMVPELRVVSRQMYLAKREAQKLADLKQELEDEEALFKDQKLTAKEKQRLEYKRQVYELAKKRKETEDALQRDDAYHMPMAYDRQDGSRQNERYEVLTRRFKDAAGEEEEELTPWKEQENWEAHQVAKASMAAGARDKKAAKQEYEFVLPDAVEFVTAQAIAGNLEIEDREQEEARAKAEKAAAAKSAFERLQEDRRTLPMYEYREMLLEALEQHQILIVTAETGSGKTTQIPQYLHEAGYSKAGRIGCTQPRRVAAMSVAARVATEVGVKLGHEVGYSIRFEDCTSDKTLIKYMTDGMLLREFLGEPDLVSYSVMMIDEAHERTLHTDVLFGLIKDIARFRPDIKLIISSATLNAEKFSEFFDYAPILNVPGRRYQVDILYTKAPEADYLTAAVTTALTIHVREPAGDILIFLTGQEEIEAAEELLKQRTRGLGSKIGELLIAPIYANLPSEQQAKIFEPTPAGARKVVLATNIAETSLTIDGIKFVVDPGFCKQNAYSPRTGMESLVVTPISQASANQRAGRAGRTAPGKCFRLYTHHSFTSEMDEDTIPEIQRTNLGNVVLMLKSLGINDLMHFDFLDPPPSETLLRALEQLYALGALNQRGELTKLGRRMAEFPLDPMLAKTIIASEQFQVSEELATICAMTAVGNAIFYRPKDKGVEADNAHNAFHRGNVGDHIALLNCYNGWADDDVNFSTQWCYQNFVQVRSMKRARDIREQLLGLMERTEVQLVSDAGNHDAIRKALAAGFFYHTASLQRNGSYRTVKSPMTVHIHPSSGLTETMPRWVVYHELVLTSKEFMRTVSEIKPAWLLEVAPHYYSKKDIVDESSKKLPKGLGKAPTEA